MQMVILKTLVVKMKSPNKFPQMNMDELCGNGRQISEAINKRSIHTIDVTCDPFLFSNIDTLIYSLHIIVIYKNIESTGGLLGALNILNYAVNIKVFY